jgi:hypothetical protein
MNRRQTVIMVLLLILTLISIVACDRGNGESVAESQIRGNVPELKDFDRFFKRDLEAYFENPGKAVHVDYELLRATPTQVAVASPKFYAWVKVYEDGVLVEEGAVRVGAVEKKEFVVINYLTKEEIARDSERMHYLFPKPVVEKITEKIGK